MDKKSDPKQIKTVHRSVWSARLRREVRTRRWTAWYIFKSWPTH